MTVGLLFQKPAVVLEDLGDIYTKKEKNHLSKYRPVAHTWYAFVMWANPDTHKNLVGEKLAHHQR